MAERPFECSHCKKAVKVIYKEIVGDSIITSEMCEECPILQQRLHGQQPAAHEGWSEKEMGLCCGNCGTSLESIKMGNPVGCSECYSVFGDLLVEELISTDHLPAALKKSLATKKSLPLHIGKSPDKPLQITPSNRITALNEALNEAVKRENYEQAAWLRDQIKAIMEKPNEGKS